MNTTNQDIELTAPQSAAYDTIRANRYEGTNVAEFDRRVVNNLSKKGLVEVVGVLVFPILSAEEAEEVAVYEESEGEDRHSDIVVEPSADTAQPRDVMEVVQGIVNAINTADVGVIATTRCLCGCGRLVKNMFAQGHDMTLRSQTMRFYRHVTTGKGHNPGNPVNPTNREYLVHAHWMTPDVAGILGL